MKNPRKMGSTTNGLMGFHGIEPRKPLGLNHSVVRGMS
jgi:hypothetical protein